jgi:hypothetical protein
MHPQRDCRNPNRPPCPVSSQRRRALARRPACRTLSRPCAPKRVDPNLRRRRVRRRLRRGCGPRHAGERVGRHDDEAGIDQRGVTVARSVVLLAHRGLGVGVPHPGLDAQDVGLGDGACAERVPQVVLDGTSGRRCRRPASRVDLDTVYVVAEASARHPPARPGMRDDKGAESIMYRPSTAATSR